MVLHTLQIVLSLWTVEPWLINAHLVLCSWSSFAIEKYVPITIVSLQSFL